MRRYRFIQVGLAVAALPYQAVNPLVREQDGLAVIPLAETWAERHFVICVCDRAALTLPTSRLIEHLMATC